MTTDLAHRATLTALVGTYQQATAEIEQAYAILAVAQGKLRSAFIGGFGSFDVIRRNHSAPSKEEGAQVIAEIKRQAWRCIVDRLEIRKILSIKRREELDRQLIGESRNCHETPAELPEITEANILAMFQDGMAKATGYANEAVHEVFEWLRPCSGRLADLKTNEKWRIGKKVIIGYAVEAGWSKRGSYRVNYSREKNLIALDNVFHMLDGRGPLKSHYGPLCDAIKDSHDGTGETDFFKFKCHKNQNLHIEFKRLDLVAKINKTAGGNRLKGV